MKLPIVTKPRCVLFDWEQGLLERVAVIFSDSDDMPLERFIFRLSFNNQSCSVSDTDDAPNLEFSLRSLLMKLAASGSLTKSVNNQGSLISSEL